MNFFKNLFQRLSFNAGGKKLRQAIASAASNKAKPQPQQTAQANSKSTGLTPAQLAEVLSWLSRY